MNIDCDIVLTDLDNILEDYNSDIQKIMILQVIQHIFCEILIGGRKIVNSDNIFFNVWLYDMCGIKYNFMTDELVNHFI